MEPIKQLSVLLESSMEATIHDTLDYFLRLLYDKLERGPKRHVGSCTVFNTFVNKFRQKLLTLLDDVEQFFLWVVAAALDGRKTNLEWSAPVWDHRDIWTNVTNCCDVCPFGLTCAADGRVPRCGVLVGDFVHYILLYIMVVMGASLTLLFNGPTSRNVAGYKSGDWCDL